MDKQISSLSGVLLIAGIIEFAVGLLHFAMPAFAYRSKGFSLLRADEINFVTLLIFAVGILLMAFGWLTIFLSRKVEPLIEFIHIYVLIKIVLWSGRVFLEILYPVNLNMFYVEPFTVVVLPGLIVEWFLFVVSID